MMTRYKIYWIYDDRQKNDPLKDGYIGLTTQTIEQRLVGHKTQKYNAGGSTEYTRKLYSILQEIPDEFIKIKEIMWTYEGEMAECIEKALRPTSNIGWNVHKGGKTIGVSRPFDLIAPDGTRTRFNTMSEARAAGWNDGHISMVLNPKYPNKTVKGYTAEYVL